jgi:anti-sigma factor RsiW
MAEESAMACSHSDQLTAYVDGELALPERRELEEHLKSCVSCPGELAILRQTAEQLSALPAIEPSADLRRRVLHGVDASPTSVGRSWFAQWLTPVVSLAVAAALAVLIIHIAPRPAPRDRSLDSADVTLAENLDLMKDLPVVASADLSDSDLEVVAILDQLEKAE